MKPELVSIFRFLFVEPSLNMPTLEVFSEMDRERNQQLVSSPTHSLGNEKTGKPSEMPIGQG
jgi:hypothetical protein